MKKYILSSLLLLSAVGLLGQTMQVTDQVPAGEQIPSSQTILAKKYDFAGEYPTFRIDSLNRCLFVRTTTIGRGKKKIFRFEKGHLYMFDLENGGNLWSQEMDFDSKIITYSPKGLMVYYAGTTTLRELKTGRAIWSKKMETLGFDDKHRIILAMKPSFNSNKGYKLKGIEIETGETLWESKERYKNGWDDLFSPTDSTLVMVSNGLHGINVKKGPMWYHEAKTSVKDYAGSAAASAFGIALGLFTGVGFIAYPVEALGLVSNIPVENSNFYIANYKTIGRFNVSGIKIWEQELPGKGSQSQLFIKGDSLFMVNLGYVEYNNKLMGEPYVACFSKVTGSQIFYQPLKDLEETDIPAIINGLLKTDDGLYLLYPNGASYIDLNTLSLSSYNWDTKANKKLVYFCDKAYLHDPVNQTVSKLDVKDNGNILLLNKADCFFEVNSRFEIVWQPEPEQVLYEKGQWKNYTFLGRDDSPLYVIDENEKIVAELAVCNGTPVVYQDKLYFISENTQILEIDLNQLSAGHFLNTK